MLEKPDIPDERIIACLQANYGLRIQQVTFLPLGGDINTAVYRAQAEEGTLFFANSGGISLARSRLRYPGS